MFVNIASEKLINSSILYLGLPLHTQRCSHADSVRNILLRLSNEVEVV